jgi:hypothetical protein
MKKLVLLVAGIALLAVACRAEINVLVDIEEDKSGTIAFEFGLDDDFRELIESSGGTTDDVFGEFDLGIDGGTVTERTEGDMTYTGATQDFDDISTVMTDLVGDTSGEGLFTEFSFVMDDETAELSAAAAASTEDLGGDIPLDPSELTDDVFSANFILDMPGTVVEHNADEVLSDGRLLWALPILGGEKTFIAKSEFGGGSSLWWLWIILGVVLVAGVAAIIAAVVLGKRQEKQAVTDAASQYPQVMPAATAGSATALDAPHDAADHGAVAPADADAADDVSDPDATASATDGDNDDASSTDEDDGN